MRIRQDIGDRPVRGTTPAAPMRFAAVKSSAVAVFMTFSAGAALAQAPAPEPVRTPSVVPSPSQLAAPLIEQRPAAKLPERAAPPREIAKPEDDRRLDVTGFALPDDAPAALRAALPGLTQRFTGKQRRFEDLLGAVNEVTRYMQREMGYYLGYAYLPEQTAGDGTVRIAILEGRLDRVVLEWNDKLLVKREVVEAYTSRLKTDQILYTRDVERVAFLLNDLRGISTRFEVRPGSRPGTALLVVTPSPEPRYSFKVEGDTNGTKALGEYRFTGLAQMSSPFGRGDGLTGNVLASTTGGLFFGLLGYTTPIGSDGIKVGTSVSAVGYKLDRGLFPLNLTGNAATVNVFGLYPVVRARNLNFFTLASAEVKQYTDRQEEVGALVKKDVTTVAIGTTGDFRDSVLGGGVNTYELSLINGRVNYPQGRSSALDDDPTFNKVTFGYTRLQDLITGRVLVYAAMRGQFAANNLDTTEQFRLGGPDGVRAWATGEGTGDTGATLSLEARWLPPDDWVGRIAREMVASLFFDAGYVQYRYRPRVSTDADPPPNTGTFTGAGVGLTWVRPGKFSVRGAVAQPLSGESRSGPGEKKTRFYLQAAMFFQ
jgi:hemolysin activation/secretion protein